MVVWGMKNGSTLRTSISWMFFKNLFKSPFLTTSNMDKHVWKVSFKPKEVQSERDWNHMERPWREMWFSWLKHTLTRSGAETLYRFYSFTLKTHDMVATSLPQLSLSLSLCIWARVTVIINVIVVCQSANGQRLHSCHNKSVGLAGWGVSAGSSSVFLTVMGAINHSAGKLWPRPCQWCIDRSVNMCVLSFPHLCVKVHKQHIRAAAYIHRLEIIDHFNKWNTSHFNNVYICSITHLIDIYCILLYCILVYAALTLLAHIFIYS